MGSITITAVADDEVIGKAREYAKKNKTSLNALASDWLKKLAVKPPRGDFDDIFDLMDRARGNSNGQKWKREELYRV